MTSVKKESKNENNENEKNYQIFYLEEKCYYGKNCRGFRSGKCPYNHYGLRGTIRSNVKNLPYGFCKFESLDCSKNTRCKRKACAFDHLKGKIKFVNGTDKVKLVDTKSTSTDNVCIVIEKDISTFNETKDNINKKKEDDIKQKEKDIKQKQEEKDIKQEQEEKDIKQKQKEKGIKQKQKEKDIKKEGEFKKKIKNNIMKKEYINNKKEYIKEKKYISKFKGKSKKSKFEKTKSDKRYGFKNLNLDMKSLSAI